MGNTRLFEQDGRVLVLSDTQLSEVSPKTKPFHALYTLSKRSDEEDRIASVMMGSFALFGMVSGGALGTLFYTINNRNSDINTILIEGTLVGAMPGVFWGFVVMAYTLSALAGVFAKDGSGFFIKKLDLINSILHTPSVSNVFEYYDTTMAEIELRHKVSHAEKLFSEANSDLAVYEDLKKKKEKLQEEYSSLKAKKDVTVTALTTENNITKQSEYEQEVLKFLNAS